MNKKSLLTIVVLVAIVGAILYLESHKQKGIAVEAVPLVSDVASSSLAAPSPAATSTSRVVSSIKKSSLYPRAVELALPQGFINTPPFTLQSMVGNKVVLLDFWTYSCINCQRTIPYLKAWYQKYKDLGLVVVGVHTPEFEFEKDMSNIQRAVTDLGIQYPVVNDSLYGTWNAYQNRYWPHELLIDIDGYIVHDNVGEGQYADTEQAIQKALRERSDRLGLHLVIPTSIVSPTDAVSVNTHMPLSAETYFGSARSVPGAFTLVGDWKITPEFAESPALGGQILYDYQAKNVYMVASAEAGATVTVKKDGVVVNTIEIKAHDLYHVVSDTDYGAHKLELDISGTLDAFTFTFG